MSAMTLIIEQYGKDVDALPEIHSRGGGAARNASGLVYENLIKRTCISLKFNPKKNDYFRTKEINGKSLRTLQVDWHVYNNNDKLTKLVESKTYLDRCYLERAVTDFIKLNQSPDVPDDAEYCIFAGQNACADDAIEYYKEYFKHETGKELTIFFVNPQRKRSSTRPIYKEEYRSDFVLDKGVYNEFMEWLNN